MFLPTTSLWNVNLSNCAFFPEICLKPCVNLLHSASSPTTAADDSVILQVPVTRCTYISFDIDPGLEYVSLWRPCRDDANRFSKEVQDRLDLPVRGKYCRG